MARESLSGGFCLGRWKGHVCTPACDSVHRGVSVPASTTGASLPRGSLSRGSLQGGLWSGGSMARRFSI